jgi:predicted membrane protein
LVAQDGIREKPVTRIVSTDFFFENKTDFGEADSALAKPIALGLLWAIVLLIVARATVLQTRLRKFSPRMIYIVFTALVVSIFIAWDNSVLPNAVKQPQASFKEAS